MLLALFAGGSIAVGLAFVVGNPFNSNTPTVTSVGTAIPQLAAPGVIATASPAPPAATTPIPRFTNPGAATTGGTSTAGGPTGATGPVAARACTGDWGATLLRSEEEMRANGFTQADVIFDAPLAGPPQFTLVGEPTIEAEQFLSVQPDSKTSNEWDLFIDRRGDAPFPMGTHRLTLEIAVAGEVCRIPLTLVVTSPR